jgi:hypothetical protein
MLRKAELENQLIRARGTDFAGSQAGAVAIGTRVRVTELTRQNVETFTILGAWDLDPGNHVVGYLSPLAQSLLGKKPGDEAEVELEGHTARYRIDAIEAYEAPKSAETPIATVAPGTPTAPTEATAATDPLAEPIPLSPAAHPASQPVLDAETPEAPADPTVDPAAATNAPPPLTEPAPPPQPPPSDGEQPTRQIG